jgi:predicted unusual protein kinase regulating ubiquinone biosynthesis (AarF/ABC1/UbiB family)
MASGEGSSSERIEAGQVRTTNFEQKSTMKLTGNHLQRYKQIAKLMWKYGRSDLVDQMGVEDALDDADRKASAPPGDTLPEQLADDLEAMGPTYVKLGQILASRPDLLPEPYTRALARLQDKVKPFPYEEVEQIVATELGTRISKAFSRFDPTPIAAASLGQVHSAALRDGREVVVKVQRPNIAKQITEDFEVLAQIAEFLEAHTEMGKKHRFGETLEEFHITIQHELDYEREAQNQVTLGKNLEEFELIQVPQPVLDYTTRRVLTMDYVRGRKITKLSPIARLDIDGCVLAEELFRAYLRQVLVDGIFHADPHPGNVFLTDDGRVALLDLGMVGHTTPAMQQNLLKVLIAISEGKAEDAAKVIIEISETTEEFDAIAFNKRIAQLVVETQDRGLNQINVGRTLLEVTRAAADLGLFVPSDLTMLGKTLLQLDEVGKILDPAFDPNDAIRRNVTEIMTKRLRRDATQGSAMKMMLDLKDFLAGLPDRLNRIMDSLGDGALEVNVRATDANLFMEGLQKIANRITTGIILASLIIGASLLMRVETSFEILGYPGLAMLCFLGAAAGGVWLLASIIVQDRRASRKRVHKAL